MRYHVIPFLGQINGKQSPSVSEQLEEVINQGASNGWKFEHLTSVNVEVKPGCLYALFGAQPYYTQHDMVVFSECN